MQDQLEAVKRLFSTGESFAVAHVVNTFGSAPRPAGSAMVVAQDGTVTGSLSGGCIEGAVYEFAQEAIVSGQASLHHFGISDDEAFGVGLTCGGTIDIFVQPLSRLTFSALPQVEAALESGRPVALATVIRHPDADMLGRHIVIDDEAMVGDLSSDRFSTAIIDDAKGVLSAGANRILTYGDDGRRIGDEIAVFVESFVRPPRMIVFGAVDFAAAVAHVGSYLGFHVTVCDARPVFATRRRFPSADDIVVSWPHAYVQHELEANRLDERTVVCVLTHDAKFDIPLLKALLELPEGVQPRYIGAMGSRRTHATRTRKLLEAGVSSGQLNRLRSPIGLDLGARTPEETAISIVGEIIAERWGGEGGPLSSADHAIHRNPDPVGASHEPREFA